ncbi:hypothetical protein DFH28DRAFT_880299 [Melampsora americana]|nr:hypothetical protein DFH28DRAFT_880299 [Melampsora americana]
MYNGKRVHKCELYPILVLIFIDHPFLLEQNGIFLEERSEDRLKFGTSAFHAYVHRWSCQLQYNPRLNAGWGLSDGEGLEREWAKISTLISALRWASKQFRADALHLKLQHNNTISRGKAGKSARHKLKQAQKKAADAAAKLRQLQTVDALTLEYFRDQWERQRACQAEIMGEKNLQKLQERLGRLIDLEEEFQDQHARLRRLRRRRRTDRSDEDHEALLRLPNTLVELEEAITELADELGGDAYRDMPEVNDPRARLCMRIRVSKEKLYEAMVGKIEWQKKWNQPGLGTSEQVRYKSVMEKRNKALALKYGTYKSNVEAYHEQYPEHPAMDLPTLEDLKAMDIAHCFWNIGHLTHPDEPWAVDVSTQIGIQAFRTSRSCAEELERIACEVQHMIRSALLISERLSNLQQLCQIRGSY